MMTITMEMIRTAMNHGYLVVEEESLFTIYKIPTRINPDASESKLLFQRFATFEDAFRVIINTIDPPDLEWGVILRFDQGMGPQMKTLEAVKAKDIATARERGREASIAYLQSKKDLKKAKIIEIRVSPPTSP